MNAAELWDAVHDQLSEPSTIDTAHAHHGYRQAIVVTGGALRVPLFADVLAPYAPVREAWLSWINPGGYVVAHRDQGPHYERWQVPLDGTGEPFRVEQWTPHEVRNDTAYPRVRLVIDRDVVAHGEPNRFEYVTGACRRLP